MSKTNIYHTLSAKMASGAWAHPVQYPNQDSWTTPTNSPWLRFTIFYPQDDMVTLASTDRQPVLIQVDIFAPKLSGANTLHALTDQLQALFSKRTKIALDDGFCEVVSFRASLMEDETYYRMMCEIDINAYIERI